MTDATDATDATGTPTTGPSPSGPARSVAAHEVPTIARGSDAAELATAAYARLFAVLDRLEPQDVGRPTDCAGWDIDDILGHLLGAARGHASLPEFVRQFRRGRAGADAFGGSSLDAMNDLQVREHAAIPLATKIELLREVAPVAVRKRTGLPGPARRLPIPIPSLGSMPAGLPSRITLGHLNDVVLTRDVFMHRLDIARAADLDPQLDGDADRRVVADIVAEWLARYGRPVQLRLRGAAGGEYHLAVGGPVVDLDVVAFCRGVSGRDPEGPPLGTAVLF